MSMPETSINKYNGVIFWEYEIGLARQSFAMKPVPEAHRMQVSSDNQFEPGILPSNPRHHATTGLPVDNIRHGQTFSWIGSSSCPFGVQ